MRMSLMIIFFIGCLQAVQAQPDKKQEAWTVLQKLADVYGKATRLSFDVTYRYAAEEAPGTWLDSLNGRFKLHGSQYWCDINNTESVYAGGYMILLFKEDQIMYLAKPSVAPLNPPGGGKSPLYTSAEGKSPVVNPVTAVPGAVSQFENLLKNDSTIRCHVKEINNQKRVTIEFTVPALYKKIEYYINNKTGYLEKMINVVKSDQLYDASVQHLVEADESYAIVEAVYSNYRPGNVDDNLFNINRYFKKEGNDYITVAPYDMYKIFLGTPNL
jgi:hypothetical protein